MNTYAFDIEVFKNLFTATFINVEHEEDTRVFTLGFGKAESGDLVEFLTQELILVGYNCDSYDSPILRHIILYNGEVTPKEIFNLSNKLVNDAFKMDKEVLSLRYPKNVTYSWDTIDLMRILAFDKLGISLKQTAINLKWHKIQDIPISPDADVPESKLDIVLSYNLNDTLITKKLYEELKDIRALRSELSKLYNINLNSASDSRIANMILENIYSNQLKRDISTVRKLRTPREKVHLKECIAKFVHFDTPYLQDLLEEISSTYVYNYNDYRYRL